MTEHQTESCKIDVSEKIEPSEPQTPNANNNPPGIDQAKECKIGVPEKIDTTKALDNIKQVYGWAASGVGEIISFDQKFEETDKFYKTPLFNALLYKFQNTERSLNQISGLQGTGKTRLLRELAKNVKPSLRFKWTSDWKDNLGEYNGNNDGVFYDFYDEHLKYAYEAAITELERRGQNAKLRNAINPKKIRYCDKDFMESFIGKAKINKLKEQAFFALMHTQKLFLIDMPDYSKSNANAMVHDIDEIQEFFESMQNADVHFVITVQRELVQKAPHFFWGKCDKYILEPLSTDQLIEAYKLNPGIELFDSAALRYLAELSRGVFRRFKRYIRLTIEANQEQKLPMDIEIVKIAITENVLFEDLDQELANLFEKEESRRIASRILNYLRSNKESNIKTIAEAIGISETIAQKTVQRLFLYGYVSSRHGEGKEKRVSLQL